MKQVAVIGAGVVGLATALRLQEELPNLQVTLIADKFSPETTSDGAAGIWGPFLCGNTPEDQMYRWSKITHDLFRDIWRTGDGGILGISMIPCMRISSMENFPEPLWKDVVYGFREMSPKELSRMNKPNITRGFMFVTFICESSKLLPYLLQRFKKAGGIVQQKRVTDLMNLKDTYDIVVNCSGIGARELVNDQTVHPIRGHIIRVKAPQVMHVILDEDDDGNYIIPNQDVTVLGGTHQEGDWTTSPYDSDRDFITQGCFRFIPSLQEAPVINEWVGLRPGRPSVRIETETFHTNGKPFTIIHNYGHGGSGVTIFWGCAQDVKRQVKMALEQTQSKL